MPRRVTILGSTGSIGNSALNVARAYPDEIIVHTLSTNADIAQLDEQVREFAPKAVAIMDPQAAEAFRERHPDLEILIGIEGLCELAAIDCDIVLCGVVGGIGLRPILSAIENSNDIALANKEPMVMAGQLIMASARAHNVNVLPVDSEHNAIFQCLHGHASDEIYKIHLTASGGPFYQQDRQALANVTPEQAANHPTWNMGAKISIDSATLMNKGLEIIEAMWLFDVPLEKIDVVIHPQSIIHSLVEFTDGSILAHLGVTDMTLPIQYALSWPKRVSTPMARLDLTTMNDITFAKPDFSEFPCLALARQAAQLGGTAGAILNAANETAVQAFRDGEISFLSIAAIIKSVMENADIKPVSNLEAILAADADSREGTKHEITTRNMA
ncbi:MAG: 1-deoxy-D-xylulose-5-phosphate reductoisomerase [Candidatus Hydrogenedentota bacterium]